jgi:hypothetical protein
MSTTAGSLTPVSPATSRKLLNYALWGAQLMLALAFGMAGWMKVATPIALLAAKMPWVADAPLLVRFIGTAELLGAVGVLLPALSRIKPALTSLAAVGLSTVMVLAAAFHISRGEPHALIPVGVLGALSVFVAWGRFKKAPIAARA